MIITATYDTMTKACEIKADGEMITDAFQLSFGRLYSYDENKYTDKYGMEVVSRVDNEDGSTVMTRICASDNGDLVEVVEAAKKPKEKAEVLKEISDFLTPKK